MDLKNFIAASLTQIMEGVIDAQKVKYEIINEYRPPAVNPNQGSLQSRMREVEFDVAITVTEGSATEGGGGIQVYGLRLGAIGNSEQSHTTCSRVKFSVPLHFPSN